MRSMVSRGMLAMLAVFLGALPAWAQSGSLAGRVTSAETAAPLVGVRVEVTGAAGQVLVGALTGSDGRFHIANVAPGTYAVVARQIGHEVRRVESVQIVAGQATSLNIELVPQVIQLNPVQVSVGRREEKVLEAPARVEVIRSREIEERPALVVTDHIRGVAGVDIASSGLVQSNVVTRGFNNVFSTALMMISDHRHASVPSLRVNAPYMIPVSDEDIEQIELVVGPAAALYGPNSANGVLHAITKSPFTSAGTRLSLGGGERSVFQGGLRHAGVLAGERVGYRVSGQYFRGDDWEFVDPAEPLGLRDPSIELYKGDGRVDVRLTGNTTVVFSGGINQVGNAVEMTPLGAAQAREWRYLYFQTRLNHNRLFAQAFVNTSDAGETFLLRTQQPIVDRSRLFVGQLQHGVEFGTAPGQPNRPMQSFIYGVDYQHTQPRTEGTILGRNEGVNITEVGAYIQSETRLHRMVDLVLAGRIDNHNHLPDAVFSPRAALVFKPTEGQNIRFTYNRAFSNPIPNNLFLDILAGEIPPLYDVRAVGVPQGGYAYNRECAAGVANFCMLSPFAPQAGWIPANAVPMWDAVVAAARQSVLQQTGGLIDLADPRWRPGPGVGTVLRTLDPTEGFFRNIDHAVITDVTDLRPTISNVFEVGYKGLIGDRVLLAADLWHQRRNDFTGPLMVETPNVFFDLATLTQHFVQQGMPQQVAQQVAAGISGLPENRDVNGIPLGQVTFDHEVAGPGDLLLTYRTFGEVELWGADLSAQVIVTDRIAVNATYSHVSRDFFEPEEVGGPMPVALNAPRNKGSFGMQYRHNPQAGTGLTVMMRSRFVDSFPMNSGVYIGTVDSYAVLDATLAYRLRQVPGLQLALSAQNLLDERHRQWIGAPELGRLVMTKLTYEFGPTR